MSFPGHILGQSDNAIPGSNKLTTWTKETLTSAAVTRKIVIEHNVQLQKAYINIKEVH